MDINALQYGNPTIDQVQNYLNISNYLDILLAEFTSDQYAFPTNDSNATRAELNDLKNKSVTAQTDAKLMERYQGYDQSLISLYNQSTFDDPEETKKYQETVISIFKDVMPLIFKVKTHFQRPRPYQLASTYKLTFFPFYSYCADSPAYPSLYACLGRVLCGVLINHYPSPSSVKYFNDIGIDIGLSRLYMGLNYQSSIDAGVRMGDRILKNVEFQKKYKL